MALLLEPGQSVVNVEKDKDARRDYRFHLADIIPQGDSLATVNWVVPSGITVDDRDFNGTDVVFWISGGVPKQWYVVVVTYLTVGGYRDQFVVRLYINEDVEALSNLGSALFPNKFTAISQLRRDRMMLVAQNHFAGVTLDSDYLWEKLAAAESEVAHTLRVRLVPTKFFATAPTDAEVAALNGMPWEVDPGYDHGVSFFDGDRWGLIAVRNKPLISVERIRFVYPTPTQGLFDIPLEWMRIDKKYGHIRLVPVGAPVQFQLSSFMLIAANDGRQIPQMMQVTYVAGLENAARDYPELIDVVKKIAVLKIVEDGFLPQSGSISADGLSQSMSIDMDKYQDSIDRILHGGKGSNGGLMAAINGIRMDTLGV